MISVTRASKGFYGSETSGRRRWKLPASSKDGTQLPSESCALRIYAGTKICDSHFYPALMGRCQSRPLFAVFAIFRLIDPGTNPISQPRFVLNAPAAIENRSPIFPSSHRSFVLRNPLRIRARIVILALAATAVANSLRVSKLLTGLTWGKRNGDNAIKHQNFIKLIPINREWKRRSSSYRILYHLAEPRAFSCVECYVQLQEF